MSSNRQWLHATDAGWKLEFADGSTAASPPVVALNVTKVSGLRVNFDGSTSFSINGPLVGYSWSFGDGGTATSAAPSHIYAGGGTYDVGFSVTDQNGLTSSRSTSVTVEGGSVDRAPVPAFSTIVTQGTVHVDGSASVDPDGSVVNWSWNFGDGRGGSGQSLDHTYTAAGNYLITLTVTDDRGSAAELTKSVTVSAGTVGTNIGPTPNFTATTPTSAGFVALNAAGSIDPDGSIVAYEWAFGDGSTGSGPMTNHTYTTSGTFQVILTVTDNGGASAQASQTVSVSLATPVVSPTQPSGTGIVGFQSLSGSVFSSRVNSAGAGSAVSFPAGTFSFSNFGDGTQTISEGAFAEGALLNVKALLGTGTGKTILEMVPNTSNKAGDVPPTCAGGLSCPTNNLSYITMTTGGAKVDGVTILGTSQGHNYNGLRFESIASPVLSNTEILHIPGTGSANPDETFHVNFQRASGTATVTNVLADGQGVGAAGLASNSCSAHFVIQGLTTKGMRYSAGWASWQQTGVMDFYNWHHLDGPRAFGAERLAARVNFFDPVWAAPTSGHDVTYTWESTYVGGSIYFVFSSAAAVPTRKLVILTNKVSGITSSVTVTVGGVTKATSDYVSFI